jgi:hypothetical protein
VRRQRRRVERRVGLCLSQRDTQQPTRPPTDTHTHAHTAHTGGANVTMASEHTESTTALQNLISRLASAKTKQVSIPCGCTASLNLGETPNHKVLSGCCVENSFPFRSSTSPHTPFPPFASCSDERLPTLSRRASQRRHHHPREVRPRLWPRVRRSTWVSGTS